jgi:NAD-dependent deacetylase
MRPSVVWFGESLPEQILQTALQATQKADLMLVVGTSAQVYPAAALVDIAIGNGTQIIVVNTEASDVSAEHVTELVGCAGELLPQLFTQI